MNWWFVKGMTKPSLNWNTVHWSPKEIRIRILNYDSVRISGHEDSVIFSMWSICCDICINFKKRLPILKRNLRICSWVCRAWYPAKKIPNEMAKMREIERIFVMRLQSFYWLQCDSRAQFYAHQITSLLRVTKFASGRRIHGKNWDK